MARREKPAKSNQTPTDPTMIAVAGAEIPRKSAPCVAESHRLDPAGTTICFASRPRFPLRFFRQGYESNLGCIYRDGPSNSRPATAGTNSSERQQFRNFRHWSWKTKVRENLPPAY